MKTIQLFVISILIISGAIFGGLYLLGLPQSAIEWIISDISLGIVVYMSYLIIVMTRDAAKAKVQYS